MTSPITTRRLRRASLASVAAMAVLGLTACGSDESGSKASDPSSSSAVSSSAATSTADKPAAGSDVSPAEMASLFSAAFAEATTAHVTLSSKGGSFPISAEGDASFSNPTAVSMTMNLASMGKADVRLVDHTVYIKLPTLGEKYLKFDLDDPNNPLGSAVTDQLNPAELVKSLQGAITKATYVGNEDVNGEKLDHYSLQVDSKKMLAGAGAGASVPSSAAGSAALPASLTYDMWFDDKGEFRQMKFDLGSQGTFTGTFSKWGEDVKVAAPPADEVTDLPGLPSATPSS